MYISEKLNYVGMTKYALPPEIRIDYKYGYILLHLLLLYFLLIRLEKRLVVATRL